ncbi:MAG: hypothetical protein HC919_15480 [Oscillatoriales cyanobacterium SM2_2_1]|nr:hypothetical protein [Oscillatoriales cyanobacterium SM2_2_1]
MTEDSQNLQDTAAIAVHEPGQPSTLIVKQSLHHYGERPIMDGGFRAADYFQVAGTRPIGVSTLQITREYSSGGFARPVVSTGMEVVSTFKSSGDRPVMADAMPIVGKFYSSGERPVSATGLVIQDTYTRMGGVRPIASNVIDNAPVLMGYID